MLLDKSRESAAIALACVADAPQGIRVLMRELRIPPGEAYARRGPGAAELRAEFVAHVVREARDRGMATVFVHTHPFESDAHFSAVDDKGETVLKEFLDRRVPGLPHASLVLGENRSAARGLGLGTPIDVVIVGDSIEHMPCALEAAVQVSDPQDDPTYDRQVRALGPSVQARLGNITIGIVGLGGTGSIAAQQCAHLGVTSYFLIDPDVLEPSNLSRVVGATARDVGRPKVHIAGEMIRRIVPMARVEAVQASVLRADVVNSIRGVDAVLCCTDSHGSRYVLNELAYRYLVPCIDHGVVIVRRDDVTTHVNARVQMLAPGLACLACSRILDPEQIRRDLLTDYERAQDPYIIGGQDPHPAVISINGVAVSLGITMLLGALGAWPTKARYQIYDALRGTVRSVDLKPAPRCVTCSMEGALAVGDSWPAPGRPS